MSAPSLQPVDVTSRTLKIILGFALLWLLLDRMAAALGSLRGEWGVAVCIAVLIAAVVIEALVSGRSRLPALLSTLGLRAPNTRALVWTLVVAAALLCFYPAFALAAGSSLDLRDDWWLLLPGLFAQGGIAEETIFRGYLFRHFREGRSFWQAAWVSAIPFTAVHLLLFLSLEFTVALISVLVALSLSFPLAWLYERAGNSIWPPAIMHFVLQGSIKLIETDESAFFTMAVAWLVVGACAPWVFFLMKAPRRQTAEASA